MFSVVLRIVRHSRTICRTLRLCEKSLIRDFPDIAVAVRLHSIVERNYFSTPQNLSKHGDRKHTKINNESDTSEGNEGYEIDVNLEDVDGKSVSLVKARVTSLRLDNVLKAGLRMAKNKTETAFYESKIRVNGEKPLKKSKQLHVGDEIDFIIGKNSTNADFLDVSRIQIVSAYVGDSDEDKLHITLKCFKNLTIDSYKN